VRQLQFPIRRLLSLLDKGMHDNHAPTDKKAVERPANADLSARA
jgi:hypothetical protein